MADVAENQEGNIIDQVADAITEVLVALGLGTAEELRPKVVKALYALIIILVLVGIFKIYKWLK